MLLRASYEKPGTGLAHSATSLRACYTMSGTDLATRHEVSGTELEPDLYQEMLIKGFITEVNSAIGLRRCYAVSGTDVGYCHAVSGTDVGYHPLRSPEEWNELEADGLIPPIITPYLGKYLLSETKSKIENATSGPAGQHTRNSAS
eukprot:1975529-Rhodomonas_salina.1